MLGLTGEILPAKVSGFYVQSSLGARVDFPIAFRDAWVATINDEDLDYRVADVPPSAFPAAASLGWGTIEEMADAELNAADHADNEAEAKHDVRDLDDPHTDGRGSGSGR